MTAPQLRYYAAPRAGHQAIIDRDTGNVAAWIIRDGDRLRARRGAWLSRPVDTVPQLLDVVSERFTVHVANQASFDPSSQSGFTST